MTDPLIVDVTRGPVVESRHVGIGLILDADGGRLLAFGDTETPVFGRSAVKAMQAIPLVETGAASAAGFGQAEIALACSSHTAEPRHVTTATKMLEAVGEGPRCLECGAQIPAMEADHAALILAGEKPKPIHNNCSGKHAGMIALAKHIGADPEGYIEPEHRVQKEVHAALEALTGAELSDQLRGRDGCSIPTYAMPLEKLANAFARLGTGVGLEAKRAAAARQIVEACMAEPFMVAGTGRFCTDVMAAFEGRVFVKTGAEGVFCGLIAELGVGISLKCLDGTTRAAEAMMAAVLEKLLRDSLNDTQKSVLRRFSQGVVTDRRGFPVGEIRCIVE